MDRESQQDAAAKLRDLVSWAERETVGYSANVKCDDYYCDFGVLGERPIDIEIDDYEIEVDVEQVFQDSPVSTGELEDIIGQLETPSDETTLDAVLERMAEDEDVDERKLAAVLQAVVRGFRGAIKKAAAVLRKPLPYAPLPWPGALRDDIDYTADDFPLRYQPPPGFAWTNEAENVVRPEDAVLFPAAKISGARMILDNRGRVSWKERDDDNLATDGRWLVFHRRRDGIPSATGFGGGTPPRALDEDGVEINAPTERFNWDASGAELARKRLRELRALAERQALIDYDPLTVPLDTSSIRVPTEELRVGDSVNEYGRVKSVKRCDVQDGNMFDLVFLSPDDGVPLEEIRESYDWSLIPIATVDGVTRADRPTALSLFELGPPTPTTPTVDYDPFTVPVTRMTNDRTPVSELRLGDNITGSGWGRLLEIEKRAEDDFVTLVMDYNGRTNRYSSRTDQTWDAEWIDVPNRDAVPTAFQLFGIEVPAPF